MNKRTTGGKYEALAAAYLTNLGYRILEQNFFCKCGEADLIALHGDALVFIEVKYRKSAAAGDPVEAVTIRKQKKISAVCGYYLLTHPKLSALQVRFDVVGILGNEITLYRDAFPYCGRM